VAATAPKELPVRLLLGDLYLQKGLPEQALTEFRQLVEEQPLNAVAREALGLALREAHDITERATRALQVVGLADRADHHPSQLSGGQQQRVAIARALVNQPALILADEPTGNLDSRTSIEIMGVFQKLNDAGITIVMVTHELDIAQYTKRNVVMRDGCVVSDVLVSKRLSAIEELQRLEQDHQAVQLTA